MTEHTDDDLTPSLPVDAQAPTDARPDSAGTAPDQGQGSRPIRAKRHLALVHGGDTQAPDTDALAPQKTGKAQRTRQKTAPDPETGLTVKQERFCAGVASGLCLSDAYRAAYDAAGMSDKTVHEEACRLFAAPKVSARMKQISQEKADQLRMLAASDAAAAVEVFRRMMLTADTDASKIRAAELLAKASGVFTDKVEVTDKTDRSVSELEQSIKERLSRLGIAG